GVIKLSRLTDDDGTRADNQDFRDVSAFRHLCSKNLSSRPSSVDLNGKSTGERRDCFSIGCPQSAAKSSQVGFRRSISQTFFARLQRLSCFSRWMAFLTRSNDS